MDTPVLLRKRFLSLISIFSPTTTRYWDYTLDYKNPSGSPIFSKDPEIGFGTHGSIPLTEIGFGGYKVDNGAFANLTVSISSRKSRMWPIRIIITLSNLR